MDIILGELKERELSRSKVYDALKNLKKGKALGVDGLCSEMKVERQ